VEDAVHLMAAGKQRERGEEGVGVPKSQYPLQGHASNDLGPIS
jgi:hypothetical protein